MTTIDYVLAALWGGLLFRNYAALLPLFCLLADCFFWGSLSGIERCSLTSAIYFALSSINQLSDKFRYSLWLFGLIYFTAAFDELIYTYYGYETIYYDAMPYIAIALSAYIATILFMDGGRGIGRTISKLGHFANRRRAGL